MTITEIGSFHVKQPRKTECPKCGFRSLEGQGLCVQIHDELTDFCPKCFVKFLAEHVPQMEIKNEEM